MRVVTFYSYKGGVGRTLALLNVAALLVRKGHRVLIADFDLEAPGLDAVSGLVMPAGPGRGVVEFISDYLAEGKVPDARDYCTEAFFRLPPEATPASTEGQLWVMPAGDRTDELAYKQRLSRISFAKLYTERDGFLLFEDLRSQWAKSLNFDYVLIDSRTGHTDVGGICTRQLPDHVVMVFFPNEQNLKGIEAEVRLIREQPVRIEIDAVMSRIPKLDDHQQTLRTFERRAKKALEVNRILKVHTYDDLRLLEDVVFSADRSADGKQLSKDYRDVARTIITRNRSDRRAALGSLKSGLAKVRKVVGEENLLVWVQAIREYHRDDEAVLRALAGALTRAGLKGEAAATQSEADELSELGSAAQAIADALILEQSDPTTAVELAMKALADSRPSRRVVLAAYALLCRVAPDMADQLESRLSPARFDPEELAVEFASLSRCRGGMNLIRKVQSGRLSPTPWGPDMRKHGVHPPFDSSPLLRSNPKQSEILSIAMLSQASALPAPVPVGSELFQFWLVDRPWMETEELPAFPFDTAIGTGGWLARCSSGEITCSPPELKTNHAQNMPTEGEDAEYLPQPPLSPWEIAGVPTSATLEMKSRPAFAYALFGQTDLARQLVREIDDAIASGEASADDYVMNCWRMLNRPLSELREDLLELAERRERDVAALGKGESLKIIQPPFGQRRSSRTSP